MSRVLVTHSLLAWFIVGLPPLSAEEDNPAGNDAAVEAASMLDAYASNLRSLERFDVRIDIDKSTPAPDGIVREHTQTDRLKIDRSAGLGLFVSVAEQRIAQKDGLVVEGEAATRAAMTAASISPQESFVRRFPEAAIRLKQEPFGKMLHSAGAPEVRLVGVATFPSPTMPEVLYDSIVKNLTSPVPGSTCRSSSNGEVQISVGYDDGKITNRMDWVFDSTRLVPLSIRSTFVSDSPDGTRRIPRYSEKVTWSEKGGVLVPQTITGEISRSYRVDGGAERTRVVEIYDIRFDWVSVNQDIPAEEFAATILKDPNKVAALVEKKED